MQRIPKNRIFPNLDYEYNFQPLKIHQQLPKGEGGQEKRWTKVFFSMNNGNFFQKLIHINFILWFSNFFYKYIQTIFIYTYHQNTLCSTILPQVWEIKPQVLKVLFFWFTPKFSFISCNFWYINMYIFLYNKLLFFLGGRGSLRKKVRTNDKDLM